MNNLGDIKYFNEKQKNLTTLFANFLKDFKFKIINDPVMKGVPMDVVLAGGCIRDLVLEKDIKDVDVILGVTLTFLDEKQSTDKNKVYDTSIMQHITHMCLTHNLIKPEEVITLHDTEIFHILLKHVIKKHYSIDKFFESNKNIIKDDALWMTYFTGNIMSVIKIKEDSFPYDLDIIITGGEAQHFVNKSFDYGICKASLDITDNTPHILLSTEFKENIETKTITYDVRDRATDTVSLSLTKHLPRILNKYPDYKVELINNDHPAKKDINLKMLDTVLLKHRITQKLEAQKPEPTQYKRPKI